MSTPRGSTPKLRAVSRSGVPIARVSPGPEEHIGIAVAVDLDPHKDGQPETGPAAVVEGDRKGKGPAAAEPSPVRLSQQRSFEVAPPSPDIPPLPISKHQSWQDVPNTFRARTPSGLSVASSTPRMVEKVGGSEVITWGFNTAGECGTMPEDPDNLVEQPPLTVEAMRHHHVTKAVAGGVHTVCLCADGSVYVFGDGYSDKEEVVKSIQGLESSTVTDVCCGDEHTLFLAADGSVLGMGRNDAGQLGTGDDVTKSMSKIRRVKHLQKVTRIACGGTHSLAVTAHGATYSWGDGKHYRLGHGDETNRLEPTEIQALWGVPAADVCAGTSHSMVLLHSGIVLTWGRAKKGQCGLEGAQQFVTTPTEVRDLARNVRVVKITAGGDHSAAIDDQGRVYTWGCVMEGSSSQLTPGRVDVGDESQRAWNLAVGTNHQFVCVFESGALLQWTCKLPLCLGPVAFPPTKASRGRDAPVVVSVSCGSGHAVLVTAQDPEEPAYASLTLEDHGGLSRVALDASTVQVLCRQAAQADDYDGVMKYLVPAFTHPSLMNSVAIPDQYGLAVRHDADSTHRRKQTHPHTAIANFADLRSVYESVLLMGDRQVDSLLGTAVTMLSRAAKPLTRPTVLSDSLRFVFLLLLFPHHRLKKPDALLPTVCNLVGDLPEVPRTTLMVWLADVPAEQFGDLVRSIHGLIAGCMREQQHQTLYGAVKTLELLYRANEFYHVPNGFGAVPLKVPFQQFYNNDIGNRMDAASDFIGFVRQRLAPAPAGQQWFYFSAYPFLLDVAAKFRLLRTESVVVQQRSMEVSMVQALMSGQNVVFPYFVLNVRRDCLIRDVFRQIDQLGQPGPLIQPEHKCPPSTEVAPVQAGSSGSAPVTTVTPAPAPAPGLARGAGPGLPVAVARSVELKKPLRVIFDGEEGIDEGGVRKEFFLLIVKELLDTKYGMFTGGEVENLNWFNMNSFEAESEFEKMGVVMGLAIYNGVILDLNFPPITYKKMLRGEPNLDDLATIEPGLAHGLRRLIDYDGDVEDLCQCFQLTYDSYGEVKVVDLCPNGGEVPVTNYNRVEYVRKYVEWHLVTSVQKQFDAFLAGFLSVVEGHAIHFFRWEELELLLCGSTQLDMDALRKVTKYDGSYTADHPTIKRFWDVVLEMTPQQQRDFLMFSTGSNRVPAKGLGEMAFKVQRAGPDSDKLPTSSTCFNTVLLPDYPTIEKMREKLLTAINWSVGFGLQ